MGRRELFAVSAGGLLLGTANTVLACTPYIGPKPVPINLSKCREKIATLIEFANISDKKTDEEYLARSAEHTSELQSLMRNSYAVLCLKKKKILTMNNEINKIH